MILALYLTLSDLPLFLLVLVGRKLNEAVKSSSIQRMECGVDPLIPSRAEVCLFMPEACNNNVLRLRSVSLLASYLLNELNWLPQGR
jgi:hypothetical protein